MRIIMSPSQYSTIPDEEANQFPGSSGVPTTNPSSSSNSYRTPLMMVAAVVLVVVGVSHMSSSASSVVPEPVFSASVPLEGAGYTRACIFDECYNTKCNAAVAPYTCLLHNGGPHGGWYVQL